MNYYIFYDSTTTLAIGWSASTTPPLSGTFLSVSETEYVQFLSSGTQYSWTVVNGVLTAPTSSSELLQAQLAQIQALRVQCNTAIKAGFSTTVNGVSTQITLAEGGISHDQTNLLMASVAAQSVMLPGGSGAWTAGAVVAPNSVIASNGVYYLTFNGGTTGSTIPTFPTEFSVGVTDGTVTWYKMGFRVSTTGQAILVSPQDAISLFRQSLTYINSCRATLQQLKAQVLASTTPAAVSAVVWA